jgi:hypothetical protein
VRPGGTVCLPQDFHTKAGTVRPAWTASFKHLIMFACRWTFYDVRIGNIGVKYASNMLSVTSETFLMSIDGAV